MVSCKAMGDVEYEMEGGLTVEQQKGGRKCGRIKDTRSHGFKTNVQDDDGGDKRKQYEDMENKMGGSHQKLENSIQENQE